MNKLNHKIGAVKVNLKTRNQHKLYSFMDQLSEQIQQGLSSSLDHHSQEWEEDMSIKIDRLRVDIQATTRESLLSQISIELDTAISRSLNRTSVSKDFETTPEGTDNIFDDPFEFFLNYGCLPWNVKIHDFSMHKAFEEALENWSIEKWEQFIQNKSVQTRLINTLSKAQFLQLLHKLDESFTLTWDKVDKSWKHVFKEIKRDVPPNLIDDSQLRLYQLLLVISGEKNNRKCFRVWFDLYLNQSSPEEIKALSFNAHQLIAFNEPIDGSQEEQNVFEVLQEWLEERNFENILENNGGEEANNKNDSYFIQNAGLILLWPGFSHLFKKSDYLSQHQFIDEKYRERAVVLLHYLWAHEYGHAEYEMTMNKILCGLAPEVSINTQVNLTDEERRLADEIRKEVRTTWEAASKFSEKELIANFFLREGKITRQENGWLLQVERKVWDVLLDKLPWGIGVIRLPWMEKLIYVEW